MAAETYRYDLPALASAHEDINASAARLGQTHERVTALMGRLRQTWSEGSAADAWHGYQSEWNAIFADVTSELASLGAAADLCRANAQCAETHNCEIWTH